jgi:hypothetical protein
MQNTDDTKGRLALWISASLFAIFVGNLFVAGILRQPAFLSDVMDMLSEWCSARLKTLLDKVKSRAALKDKGTQKPHTHCATEWWRQI